MKHMFWSFCGSMSELIKAILINFKQISENKLTWGNLFGSLSHPWQTYGHIQFFFLKLSKKRGNYPQSANKNRWVVVSSSLCFFSTLLANGPLGFAITHKQSCQVCATTHRKFWTFRSFKNCNLIFGTTMKSQNSFPNFWEPLLPDKVGKETK